MMKKLLKLSTPTLTTIAGDISIAYTTQVETARAVADYYRAYGIGWLDLVARYRYSRVGLEMSSNAPFKLNEDRTDPWSEYHEENNQKGEQR